MVRVEIASEYYGERTEFDSLEEAEAVIRALGDDFAVVRLHPRGGDVIDHEDRVVGKLLLTPWTVMTPCLLEDSDGCEPNRAQFLRCMADFRAGRGIADYYFCDFSREGGPEGEAWDVWNECWREPCECGPHESDFDWTGFEEEYQAEMGDGDES